MKFFRFLSIALLFTVLTGLLGSSLFNQNVVRADTTHIVISQIQVGATGKANQEFVELYNPTMNTIDLSGWRLGRSSSSSATVTNLVASLSGSMLPHTYFLIAHPDATVGADSIYSSTSSAITPNNTIYLFSDAGKTTVDEVGMGTAAQKESNDAPNPGNDQSILRKASASSMASDLILGGAQVHDGNGYDSDNNADDFVLINTSMPRNSSSPAAPPLSTATIAPTITMSPTPSSLPATIPPTASPTFTQTPTPTRAPTATLTPSPMSTTTPTPTETPIPTVIPTLSAIPTLPDWGSPTPTSVASPTPTILLSNTMSPSVSISQTLTPTVHSNHNHRRHFVCTWKIKYMWFGWIRIFFPWLSCDQ